MTGVVGLLSFAAGMLVGGAAVGLVTRWRRGKPSVEIEPADREVPTFLERDRDVISDEFRAHTVAVRRQVSEYADTLAGDDPILRERLRQFEIGGQSC